MKKVVLALALFAASSLSADTANFEQEYFSQADQPGTVMFNPPEGWFLADPKALPPSVKIMVVGTSKNSFPPSINLGMEPYEGSLKDYLRMIKAINDSQGAEWKDLGTIRTQAGNASLSQVDSSTEWGDVRMMHVILLRDSTTYILTAAALKEEFPNYYNDFFKAMRSLRFNKSLVEMIPDQSLRSGYLQAVDNIKENWNTWISQTDHQEVSNTVLFTNNTFQEKYWQPFCKLIAERFQEMNPEWHQKVLENVKEQLIGAK
ncbi:MAG: hypothetical protein H7A37_00285 [Chlamydiales bacterium]|nr:hypothetical protein [Chlamydiia bacterium]MCP5506732.1 hypothetical protein [Chlamydiales bacterium]